MAEGIKEKFNEIPARAGELLDANVQYYKLFVFRFIAKASYGVLTIFLLAMTCLLVLFFVSFALAFAIGALLDSIALGFLSIGFFYALVVGVAFIFRKKWIERPLLRKLSEAYFKSDEDETK